MSDRSELNGSDMDRLRGLRCCLHRVVVLCERIATRYELCAIAVRSRSNSGERKLPPSLAGA